MNTIINKPISINELLSTINSCYPNALALIDGPMVILDINDNVKYTIWLKKPNIFEVVPVKAIWNRTFEMKAKAQEIAAKIKEFIENGVLETPSGSDISLVCPTCKSPNSKKTRTCEWCGNQII